MTKPSLFVGSSSEGLEFARAARVDHLVDATPDLDASVDALADWLGVRASPGGRHPGRGTRNALIALGCAPTSRSSAPFDQGVPAAPRWFGIDGLEEPRLITWAAKRHRPALAGA